MPNKRERQRRKSKKIVIDVPSNSPIVEQFDTHAIVLRFGEPMDGSFVFLPEVQCNECENAGVFVISVRCPSCHHPVNRVACAVSNVELINGNATVDRDVMLCVDCLERDNDAAPMTAGDPLLGGGPLGPKRINPRLN